MAKSKKGADKSKPDQTPGSSREPYIGGEDRPDVRTLLDRPIRDLSARELSAVLDALGLAPGAGGPPATAAELAALVEVDIPEEDAGLHEAFFELESVYAELEACGVPRANLRSVPLDELQGYVQDYDVSAEVVVRIGRLKRIFDKARRDKPRIDKAVRDGKAAADKFFKDGKSRVDKVLREGKTYVDKLRKDKGRVKDAIDAKEIKDLFELVSVRPGDEATGRVAELEERIETLRAEFDEIAKSVKAAGSKKGGSRKKG